MNISEYIIDYQIGFQANYGSHYDITTGNFPFYVELYESNYKGDLVNKLAYAEVTDYNDFVGNSNLTINASNIINVPEWVSMT